MKTLNNYIKESLLDDEEDLAIDNTVLIERFLKDIYNITGSYKIKGNIVDVDGTVILQGYSEHLTNEYFEFGKVNGSFNCSMNDDLIDLTGAPRFVNGNFDCSQCYNLKTLEGGPEIVKGSFDCSMNDIIDLKGCPKEVGNNFDCSFCGKLKSIKNISKKIGGLLFYRKTPAEKTLETAKIISRNKFKVG